MTTTEQRNCATCHNTGMVDIENRSVKRQFFLSRWEGGQLVPYEKSVEDHIGGVDACPHCAARGVEQWESAIAE